MINVAELIPDPDFSTLVTVLRVSRTMSGGEARETSTEETVRAIVEPAKPAEVLLLPEGQRHDSAIELYTTAEIAAGPDRQDVVVYGGKRFTAVKSEDWSAQGYFRTIATGYQP